VTTAALVDDNRRRRSSCFVSAGIFRDDLLGDAGHCLGVPQSAVSDLRLANVERPDFEENVVSKYEPETPKPTMRPVRL